MGRAAGTQTHRLVVVGELDARTAPFLLARVDALVAVGCRQLCLDLREADRVDGYGVKAVRFCRQLADADGCRVRVLYPPTLSESARRALRLRRGRPDRG
jgi:anti-anti-sigma regulatory factor